MEKVKCEECKDKFPAYQKAFWESKIVCQDCFQKNRNKKMNKREVGEFWKRWTK